jgi:hypothetical protein
MERRLQILLDQDRYERVRKEAERSGRSVAAVIRDAIDTSLPSDAERRAEAMDELLRLTAEPLTGPSRTWEEIKAEIEAEEVAHMDRSIGAP